jgi:hypothetical protein
MQDRESRHSLSQLLRFYIHKESKDSNVWLLKIKFLFFFYLKIHSISEVKGWVIIRFEGRVILGFQSLQYKTTHLHSFFLSLKST